MTTYNRANAAKLYQQNSINTASPAKLTLMLYDGAIKFCNIGLEGIEEKNIQKAHDNIMKAEKIIMQLRSSLDMKYPVAEDFDRVYDCVYRRLVEANMKKEAEVLKEATEHIKTMRDTWKEVMRLNNATQKVRINLWIIRQFI